MDRISKRQNENLLNQLIFRLSITANKKITPSIENVSLALLYIRLSEKFQAFPLSHFGSKECKYRQRYSKDKTSFYLST